LQYQKQLRLQEDRSLMLVQNLDVAAAAITVGYESPSQFSREYRRLLAMRRRGTSHACAPAQFRRHELNSQPVHRRWTLRSEQGREQW
jgi:AraC-like DNA-binding protein